VREHHFGEGVVPSEAHPSIALLKEQTSAFGYILFFNKKKLPQTNVSKMLF